MSLLDVIDAIPRRNLNIYIIVDRSKTMKGAKICAINDGIQNIIPSFAALNENPDVNLTLNIVSVSDDIKIDHINDFEYMVWNGYTAEGNFCIGQAFHQLYNDIRNNCKSNDFDPIFILLTASKPADLWQTYLNRLWKDDFFYWATKAVIKIGDETDENLLKEFASSPDYIISLHNIDKLKNLIRLKWSYPEWYINDGGFGRYKDSIGLVINRAFELKKVNDVRERIMYHILQDCHVFDVHKEYAFIFKTIQNDAAFERMLVSENWYMDSLNYSSQLSAKTGISKTSVQEVMTEIGIGLGRTIYNFQKE